MPDIKSNLPWIEKYRPKSLKEMAIPNAKLSGHKVNLAEELMKFIKLFFKEIHDINEQNKQIRNFNRTASDKEQKEEIRLPLDKSAILLEGKPGIGKTSIVYALANDLKMDVIETNASDTRTRDVLEKKLNETTKSRGIMDFIIEAKQKLILIDEVDGIYGTKDRGAVPTILDLIEKTQFPIILCSNEYKQSLQTLYRKIKKFEVYPLSKPEVMKIASRVLKSEKISGISQSALETIVEKNSGDLRGVINDLQAITQGGTIEDLELLGDLRRDSIEEIFSLIRDLFLKVRTLSEARSLTDKSDVDYNFLYKWVGENIPSFMYDNSDFAEAYENLALADEIFGRIRKNMYWGLLPYFYDLFAGGVALSRKMSSSRKGFVRITNPKYFSSVSLNSAEKSLLEKINIRYEISQYEVMQDFLPFLQVLSSSSRKQQKIIIEWFELDAKEKKILKTD